MHSPSVSSGVALKSTIFPSRSTAISIGERAFRTTEELKSSKLLMGVSAYRENFVPGFESGLRRWRPWLDAGDFRLLIDDSRCRAPSL